MPSERDPPDNAFEVDVRACVELLEAVARDRAKLAAVGPELRRRLVEAAGRVAQPDRAELRAMAKALRRKDHVARDRADEALLDSTGMRRQGRAPLFLTPAPAATLGGAPPGGTRAATEAPDETIGHL